MKRAATHAGSWYTANKTQLTNELHSYFNKAEKEFTFQKHQSFPIKGVRAIIGPHAGFRYSGPTAAFAYKAVDTTNIKRVFLLGPSHHAYIDGCCLSKCDVYETPLGDIQLDKEVLNELYNTKKFYWMRQNVDEEEHSIEMHLPFIYEIFKNKIDDIKLVPILVGSTTEVKERMYGGLLAKYLEDPENLFIISSDFCHWGTRFRYTYYTPSDDEPAIDLRVQKDKITRPIFESIQSLDFRGIHVLEELSFTKFQSYLAETENTICGRHPISVLMAALEKLSEKREFSNQSLKCIKYDQSSQCKRYHDSSVSYASIYIKIE
ncbi:MEMO1 family [Cokeromyces recurvatus]|uniref:MEMO1 family n=1 Tax=Cokeromyces recurvatus TaxID=90255 RepID=UPI0022202F92|nr:MEMO1 family [Cokeromyces recurvatus]KAI7905590.1 MEMO1 family [Cokeromyces recurvatus]